MARGKQPRWPKGTKWGERGPGPGRWREDGQPDAPRATWAEVASRVIGRRRGGRGRGSAQEEDYYQAQQDSRSAAAGGPRTGLQPHETDADDAARQRGIRSRYGLPADATPDETGEAIRYSATGGRVGSPGRSTTLGSAPADNREDWASRATSQMGFPSDDRRRRRGDHQRRYREAIERGDVEEAMYLEDLESPRAGRHGPAQTDEQVRAGIQGEIRTSRAARIGGAFHEQWRETQELLPDGTRKPKMKTTKDQAWIEAHGTDQVDIANTSYADLPDDWQGENRAAGEVVAGILGREGTGINLSDEAVRQRLGEEIHQAWLGRNDYARGGDLDVPFAQLPRDEQDKDTDQITTALRALGLEHPANRVVTNDDIPAEFLPDDGVIRTPDETGDEGSLYGVSFANVRQGLDGRVSATDLDDLTDEMISEAIEQAQGTQYNSEGGGLEGMSFGEYVTDQLAQMLRNQSPAELWPHLADTDPETWEQALSRQMGGARGRLVGGMGLDEHYDEIASLGRHPAGGAHTNAEVDAAMDESMYAGLSLGQLRQLREQLSAQAHGGLASRVVLGALARLIARKGG